MTLYPNTAALYLAGLVRTALAASKMKLFQATSAPIGPGTVIADLTEADYEGYAEKTITNWLAAYLDPAGGASIQSGTQQFDYDTTPGVTNVILGFYVTNAAGALVVVGTFDSPIPMAAPGDSIPNNVTLNFGAPTS